MLHSYQLLNLAMKTWFAMVELADQLSNRFYKTQKKEKRIGRLFRM